MSVASARRTLVPVGDSVTVRNTVADAALQTGLGSGSPAVIALLAVAPLALHLVTASISAAGASRGRAAFGVGLSVAILLHVAYNVMVVNALV